MRNRLADPKPQAVDHALDIARLVLGLSVGIVCGGLVAFFLSRIIRLLARRTQILKALYRRIHTSMYLALIVWGAYAGWKISLFGTAFTDTTPWLKVFDHFLLIIAIIMTTWVLSSAVWIVEDAANIRRKSNSGKSRRFETQAQVLRRVGQALVWIVGITVVLATFPYAQRALGTVLASAGIASVIAGLAAQSTLGNFFAGMQLAFTDAIRVGDVVVINGQQATVEEITLTYVVLQVWDERRMIVPSSVFTTKPFENWTRQATRQLGTIEFHVDWGAPMTLIRAKVEQLLLATDLWDGRSWSVQITDSTDDAITVRLVVSAEDAGKLWDLRCYLREQVIMWITKEQPWARPAHSYRRREAVTPEHDPAPELIAQLATELSDITDPHTESQTAGQDDHLEYDGLLGPDEPFSGFDDPVHAARMAAARRKAKRARRQALTMKQEDDVSEHSKDLPQEGKGDESNERSRLGSRPLSRNASIKRVSVFPPSSTPAAHLSSPARSENQMTRTHTFTPDEIHSLMARSKRWSLRNKEGSKTPETPSEAQEGEVSAQRGHSQGANARTQTGDENSESNIQLCGAKESEGPSATEKESQQTAVASERLYSGSPEADKQGEIFAGPGEDVLRERKAAVEQDSDELSLTGVDRGSDEIGRNLENVDKGEGGRD